MNNGALDKQFDKVLLFVLFVFLMVMAEVIFIRSGYAQGFISWMENIAGQVLAALLTLMVGARQTQRASDGGTNGKTDNGSNQPADNGAVSGGV